MRDIRFVLNELLAIENYRNLPGFEDASGDVVDAILDEGAKICEEVVFPLNDPGDVEGCRFEDGGHHAARLQGSLRDLRGGRLDRARHRSRVRRPRLAARAVLGHGRDAVERRLAFATYPGLTSGAYHAIEAHGSEAQKETYLPKLASGTWAGTMNLTEPQCGTDLGLIRTRAEPHEDGSYRITGTKIFITGGEHDLTENIVHLVLARIPGGPEGIKGISLFIAPSSWPRRTAASGRATACAAARSSTRWVCAPRPPA